MSEPTTLPEALRHLSQLRGVNARLRHHHSEVVRLRAQAEELRMVIKELLDVTAEQAKAREYARVIPLPGPKAHVVDVDMRAMKAWGDARSVWEATKSQ